MKEQSNKFGIASLVVGILSIVLFIMPYIALPLGILAIVFYAMQKKRGITGNATTGLILGIIGLAISVIMGLILLFTLTVMSAFL